MSAATVQRAGPGRLRVRECRDPELSRQLVDWLEKRPEVTMVRARPRSATIDVCYEERGLDGDLLRATRDRAFALSEPVPSRPLAISIAHDIPGRTRLSVSGADARDLATLSAWLADQPGVVAATPGLRSIVVCSELDRHDAAALVCAIEASDRSTWPPSSFLVEANPWPTIFFDGLVLIAARGPRSVVAVGIAIGALPTGRRTLQALKERRPSVDMLDLLAIAISVAVGNPGTAALITFLLAVGDFVLHLTKRRAHGALASAFKIDAQTAWRLKSDGQTERIPARKLQVGDRVLCDPGMRLPADGVIEGGAATLDTKTLTGESVPRTAGSGDPVMASSIVVEGSIRVEVRRVGRDTTAGRIVQILESAEAKPTKIERETGRIADHLVMPTLGLAGFSAFLAQELDRMTSVLITDFGTGIRISVPACTLAAMTLATREGVLVKGGQFLERLARADTIVFDKTGTLTSGKPQIVDVVAANGWDPLHAVGLAAAVESRQRHPVAEALRAYLGSRAIAIPDMEVQDQTFAVGQGVVARCGAHEVAVGGRRLMAARAIAIDRAEKTLQQHERASVSSLLIAIDGRLAAILGYADTVRPESSAVIRALQQRGRRRIVLMSGDASGPAGMIGERLGVDDVFSELLPHEKAEQVRCLQRAGRTVAMVGDGINDAPALALADVGISLTGSSDIALEAADVVLLSGGLSRLPVAFRVADDAMRSIRVGLGIVIVPNALAIVAGALGLIGSGVATVLNNGSTVAAALAAIAPVVRRQREGRGELEQDLRSTMRYVV